MKPAAYTLLIAIVLLLIAGRGFSKTSKAIPSPRYSAVKAIAIVDSRFRQRYPDNKRFTNGPGLKIRDFFVQSAVYTNSFNDAQLDEWSWVIKFVHPVHNDHSFVFQLKNGGDVVLLLQTE